MVRIEIVDGSLNINIKKEFIDNIKSVNGVTEGFTLAEIREYLMKESYVAQMIDDVICDNGE